MRGTLMRRPNPGSVPALTELADLDDSGAELEDYYPASADGSLLDLFVMEPQHLYEGRSVVWIGTPGEMVAADPEYTTFIYGNQFDKAKIGSVARAVAANRSGPPIAFYAPYGQVTVISPIDVKESIEYYEYDEGRYDRPYTTGDDELDLYLVDPEQAIEERMADDDSTADEAAADLAEELADAVAHKAGDLGALAVDIRDGNHRAFGAMVGGEPYVYVRVMANDLQRLRERELNWEGDDAIRAALQ